VVMDSIFGRDDFDFRS
ncbi:unnamed protein product, partial [Rotaria magnacalcarata]